MEYDFINTEEEADIKQKITSYNFKSCKTSRTQWKFSKESIINELKTVILIVDDLYSNRMVIREMLKRLGITSVEAIHGENAVEIVKKSFEPNSNIEIGLIFMDLNMPVMNGVQSTIQIRQIEKEYMKDTEIPIIAVTAHDSKNDKDECLNAGMQNFESKPIDFRTVKRIIKRYASHFLDNEK